MNYSANWHVSFSNLNNCICICWFILGKIQFTCLHQLHDQIKIDTGQFHHLSIFRSSDTEFFVKKRYNNRTTIDIPREQFEPLLNVCWYCIVFELNSLGRDSCAFSGQISDYCSLLFAAVALYIPLFPISPHSNYIIYY